MWFASLIFLYLSFVINLKLMKKIKILSLFVCLIALLAACEDEDITPSYGARTVLVYIAGNNSLGQSDFDSKDVSEMIEGMKGTEGTTNNLLVYFAGYKKTAKLIRLIKNGKGEVKQETVMSYDKHNSVSLDVMKDVFRTAFSNYPAKSYGIVFWSHGDGWLHYQNLDDWDSNDQMIVISGTTAETYMIDNYPDIPLQKYDSYATAKNALENGSGAAWVNDNTEVIAYALQNTGYTVGIPSLGSNDTIAPAVSKGNTTLLDWINDEIKTLGEEQFFHADYEATLVDTYGSDYEESLVVEGGVTE